MRHCLCACVRRGLALWLSILEITVCEQRTFIQCWFNVGPASTMLDQHYNTTGCLLRCGESSGLTDLFFSTQVVLASKINPFSVEIFLHKPWRPKGFQFEIIINGLVSSFRFIWIPMLWVYCHNKYFFQCGDRLGRQIVERDKQLRFTLAPRLYLERGSVAKILIRINEL